MKDDMTAQPLTEHLGELRTRLIYIACIIFSGFFISYFFSESIFTFLRKPVLPFLPAGGLHFTGVLEKFVAHLKVSFLSGVILTSPLWLFQIWRFIAPGLYSREKRYALPFIFSGVLLFLGGVAFVYFFVFPAAFKFLLGFGGDVDKPIITISSYLDFVLKMFLAFGLAFEMPLIIVFLGLMGVVDAKQLRQSRRWAVLLMAIVSAVVTPPDALSMLALLIPLMLLYELSIILVATLAKR